MKQFKHLITKIKTKLIIKILVFAGVIGVVFILGLNIGNGNINFDSSSSITGLPTKLNFSSINQVYSILRDNYDGQLSVNQVLNSIKEGIASAPGDPYTEYFTPSEANAFNSELNNSFSGIGAELGENNNQEPIVISPIQGSPAARAGLQPHDIIVSINGKSTQGMNVDTAVNDIRGPAGTTVILGIQRGSNNFTLKITRGNIIIPSVNYRLIDNNIGYIQITSFDINTPSLVTNAANQFLAEHVKGIILDLREDPGGYLSAAVGVSGLWLNQNQTILTEMRGKVVVNNYQATQNGILDNTPTVVLIDNGTASSAEITTAALHDNHKAYVIGTRSFGKGVVQQIFNLSGGAEMKVTVASWYRPDGKSINKIGIQPDEIVNMDPNYINTPKDTQLNAAVAYLSKYI